MRRATTSVGLRRLSAWQQPRRGGGKTRVAEAGRDWPRKGGSPVDGSGQEEPKRDESPKDQSDTRCISRVLGHMYNEIMLAASKSCQDLPFPFN